METKIINNFYGVIRDRVAPFFYCRSRSVGIAQSLRLSMSYSNDYPRKQIVTETVNSIERITQQFVSQ